MSNWSDSWDGQACCTLLQGFACHFEVLACKPVQALQLPSLLLCKLRVFRVPG